MARTRRAYRQGYPRAAKRTIYRQPMAILFLIVFIDLLGFGVMIPQLPFYGLHFGLSGFGVASMLACYSLAQFFGSPLLGRLSDRVGRRPVLLVSLAASAAAYLWLGLSDAAWMLFAARLMAGAGAGNIAAAQAYIADMTPPEGRAKGMGMIGAAFGLGFTLGPGLGGLASHLDPAAPAFIAAGLSTLAFVLAFLRLKESLPASSRTARARPSRLAMAREALGRPLLRELILLLFATVCAFAGMETTFALWARQVFGWSATQVGLNFLFVGIVLVVIQGVLIGRLSRRFGETRLVIAGAAAITLGLAGLALTHTIAELLVVNLLLAGGMGLLNPSISSLVSRQAQNDEQGGILGVSQSASSLARALAPPIAGMLFDLSGHNAPYFVGAVIMAGVLVLALRLPRTGRARAAAAPSEPRPS
jgi:MFS transporter, DHA1 family, tetracycline resistance protein